MARKPIRGRVTVVPRPEILDPQGQAIREALVRSGFGKVTAVQAGKSFEIEISGATKKQAEEALEAMSRTLLANPLLETYSIELLVDEKP